MNRDRPGPSKVAMHSLRSGVLVPLLASVAALAGLACTAETITTTQPAPSPSPSATTTSEPPAIAPDAGATKADAGDAGADAPTAAWTSGEEGESCATACKAKGKTCAVACKDHRSCGGHDGEPAPYAGYACYYRQTGNGGSSFRSNEGRSLTTCDEVASPTWDNFGEYKLGDYLGGNPVSCCCK